MKWSASIALISPMLAAVATVHGASTDLQQGQDAGALAGGTMQSYTGTGQAISGNLVTPFMQAGTITSPDGKTQFASNGFQSSGKPLIQITLNPDPATGDLAYIVLQQDLTGSGNLNYLQTFPMSGDGPGQEIAGVCQNGYIQCDAGFSNCRYRSWTFASTGAITAKTAGGGQPGTAGDVSSLAGCYCFDNFCTKRNSALIELGAIGSDVGGGILSAFLAANTGIAISSATSGANAAGGTVLTYFGYKPSSVPNEGETTSMTLSQVAAMPVIPPADTITPQAFYTDSASLNNAAQNALAAQKLAPNSLYNIVTNASTSQAGSYVSCTNSRAVTTSVTDRTYDFSASGVLHNISQNMGVTMLQQNGDTYQFTSTENGEALFTAILPLATTSSTVNGDTSTTYMSTSNLDVTPYTADINTDWSANNFSTDPVTSCGGTTASALWVSSLGTSISTGGSCTSYHYYTCGFPPHGCSDQKSRDFSITATVAFHYLSQEMTEATSDGCSQFESNSSCTLSQDVWDGRPVVVNGLSMNNQQFGQYCRTFTGDIRAITVCRPWFVQNRTFYCKNTAAAYDFSTIKANVASIENSASMSGNSVMRYADPTQGGAIMTLGTPTAAALPGCSQVCETKVPASQTGVLYTDSLQSGNQAPGALTASQYLFYFKDCTTNNVGNAICPLDSSKGEILVTQCGCSADMGKAVGALNSAGSAAQDAICSAN